MASIRQEKVGKLIQQELADIFRKHAADVYHGAFITVTVVRMSPDLGAAKVYLSFFITGSGSKEEALQMVRDRTSQTRGMLGKRVGKQLRIVPELFFYLDDSLDYAEEIDKLLKK
jgi:ribosome-binding factor A